MTAIFTRTLNLLGILLLLQAFTACKKSTLDDERRQILSFLNENQLSYEEIPPGVFIHRIQEGSQSIRPDQTVEVLYEGRLLDGAIFRAADSIPRLISLDSTVLAWRAAIPQLQVGAKALILTPSEFGYGREELPGIPPSTPIVFEVDILEVHPHF